VPPLALFSGSVLVIKISFFIFHGGLTLSVNKSSSSCSVAMFGLAMVKGERLIVEFKLNFQRGHWLRNFPGPDIPRLAAIGDKYNICFLSKPFFR